MVYIIVHLYCYSLFYFNKYICCNISWSLYSWLNLLAMTLASYCLEWKNLNKKYSKLYAPWPRTPVNTTSMIVPSGKNEIIDLTPVEPFFTLEIFPRSQFLFPWVQNKAFLFAFQIRVWAPEHMISQANYAIEVTPKILDFYEKFFQIEFPLPKQGKCGLIVLHCFP